MLFTDFSIINPKYEKLFNAFFLDNREDIARATEFRRYKTTYKHMKQALDNEDYFTVIRLFYVMTSFYEGKSCYDCYHITNPIYKKLLLDCLDNSMEGFPRETLEDMVAQAKEIKNKKGHDTYDNDKIIKKGVIALMTASLQATVSIDVFYDKLTQKEKEAFLFIKEKLKDGPKTLSISKMVEESNISRPIYKNLFVKMEQEKIANIKNEGVKGTWIELKI